MILCVTTDIILNDFANGIRDIFIKTLGSKYAILIVVIVVRITLDGEIFSLPNVNVRIVGIYGLINLMRCGGNLSDFVKCSFCGKQSSFTTRSYFRQGFFCNECLSKRSVIRIYWFTAFFIRKYRQKTTEGWYYEEDCTPYSNPDSESNLNESEAFRKIAHECPFRFFDFGSEDLYTCLHEANGYLCGEGTCPFMKTKTNPPATIEEEYIK